MSIPEEHRSLIIFSGIRFMRSITECYGVDKGLELWDQICTVLDPDLRGDIFRAILLGDCIPGQVTIQGTPPFPIVAIKTIRSISGLGLKEAKNIVDELQQGKSLTIKLQDGISWDNALVLLRDVGLKIN